MHYGNEQRTELLPAGSVVYRQYSKLILNPLVPEVFLQSGNYISKTDKDFLDTKACSFRFTRVFKYAPVTNG
jgi:hypothetical protein